jgi:hypothetical protein
MRPVERAAELCRARDGDFRDEMEAHLLHGVVVSTADLFVMGRAVPRSADASDIWRSWPREECDAWFVWVGVGNAARLLACMPYVLPWVGWARQGRQWEDCHWWNTAELLARMKARLTC